MILKKLKLENFRGYKNLEIEFDENFNIIVGANDIGKSTILEALDIFFGENIIKADGDDLNILTRKSGETSYRISCQFDIANKKEILIDSSSKTTFEAEFLLNKDGFLEIIQEYDSLKTKVSSKVFLNILYPVELDRNLNILKLADLKKMVKELGLDELIEDKTKKLSYRKVIYENLKNKENVLENILPIDKTFDDYNLWDKIKSELPLYFLFQSDRSNTDKDIEIQNPLKVATKKIVSKLQTKIDELKNQIKEEVEKVGSETIKELKTFNLDLAENLNVDLSMKNFDTLFSFNIIDEDNIPLNKRGSGVRRLMLLSYFMAEAKQNKGDKRVIYAIEEPETAQHPSFQNKILETFKELSNKNCQIILTTHSPGIVKQMKEEHLIFIKKVESKQVVCQGESVNILAKLIISVEGETDINFIKGLNKIPEFNEIIDLENENISFIPQKGGKIIEWINRNYLKNSEIHEIIICDNDNQCYINAVKGINQERDPRRKGIVTSKYEIENYIHPDIYNRKYGTTFVYNKIWDEFDIPKELVSLLKKTPKYKSFNGNEKKIENNIKTEISTELVSMITKQHLEEIGCYDEVENWFKEIKQTYDSI